MWDGFFFCLGGAVLYVCGTSFDRDIDLVKMATRVNKLKDLAQLFNTESKFSPLVVISGTVGSETPIICDYSPLGGVIVKKTTKLWFKKLNDVGSWIKDSSLLESIHKVVPWYLDDGTGRAFVVGAHYYNLGSVWIAKEEVFDRSVGSCLNEKLGFPTGIKILGVEHIERLLPIGASMTVIGQVVKDDTGIIKVQKPYGGHLFYVGRLTVDELLADMGMSARWFKFVSVVCVAVGVFLIAKHAVQYILGKVYGESQRIESIDQKAPRGKGQNSQKQATKGGNSTAPKNKASSTKKSTRKPHQNKRKPKQEESTTRVLSDGPKRLGQDVKGLYGKAENESDRATKDRQMTGLRVIGLEQEYNPRVLWLSLMGKEEVVVVLRFLITAWLLWFRRNRPLHGGTLIEQDNC